MHYNKSTRSKYSHLSSWGVWGIVSFICGRLLLADDLWFSTGWRSADWLRNLPTLASLCFTFERRLFTDASFTSDAFTWSSDLVRVRRLCFLTKSDDLFNFPRVPAWHLSPPDDGLCCWVERPTACLLTAVLLLLSFFAVQLTSDGPAGSLQKAFSPSVYYTSKST